MRARAIFGRYWFPVEPQGIANIPPGRVLLISNHAGQIALDAAMIACACLLEAEPPRVIRGMGEYWLPTVPWVNELMVRTGSVVGTRKNCIDLLENEEAVIAFPEGIRGMNKLIWERYQLQEFGQGFMRLALETHTPIVPIAVVGSEEQAPAIANVRSLARLLRRRGSARGPRAPHRARQAPRARPHRPPPRRRLRLPRAVAARGVGVLRRRGAGRRHRDRHRPRCGP